VNVTLSDGTIGSIPDELSDDDVKNSLIQLEAAHNKDKATPPPQPQGVLQQAFPRDQYPGVNAALDWLNQTPAQAAPGVDRALGGYPSAIASGINRATGGYAGSIGNFGANVAADTATGAVDAPASVINAAIHNAQRYGYGAGTPDIPLQAPVFKHSFGVTAPTTWAGQQAETLADLVVGNKIAGARLLPAILTGAAQYGMQGVGGAVGSSAAGAVDPRLQELGGMVGALSPSLAPKESIGSAFSQWAGLRGKNGSDLYDQTRDQGAATGNPDLMPTAGMVGSPGVAALERGGAAFPLLNIPIKNAQGAVASAVGKGVTEAANQLATPGTKPDVTAGAPGALLQRLTQEDLTRQWQAAKNAIDQVETSAGVGNLRDANGNPALVSGPALQNLLGSLGGLTGQVVDGRVIPTSVGSGGDIANSAAARVRGALTPIDPVLDRNLNTALTTTQMQLANVNMPPAAKPALYAQAQDLQNQINANKGVSFEALRRLKSEIASGITQGSVDGYTGNRITDALAGGIQQHLDAVAPALGQQYTKARQDYADAMKYRDQLTGPGVVNVVGKPQAPGEYLNPPGETDITNRVAGFLRNPERAGVLPQTPGWRDAVAALVSRLGQNNGRFDPQTFLQQWGDTKLGSSTGSTPEGRALFTTPSPEAAWLLDNSQAIARALEQGPETHGGEGNIAGPLATTAIAEHVMGTHGLGSLVAGGLAASGLERPGTIRALAGRPAPYFQQTSPLPAIMAVAQAQGRNQGY
jgi:hypothetical protein